MAYERKHVRIYVLLSYAKIMLNANSHVDPKLLMLYLLAINQIDAKRNKNSRSKRPYDNADRLP